MERIKKTIPGLRGEKKILQIFRTKQNVSLKICKKKKIKKMSSPGVNKTGRRFFGRIQITICCEVLSEDKYRWKRCLSLEVV